MQRERRHNPYPLTWEIPVGIACLVLLLLVLGAHGGRAAANLAAGGGLTFPPATELFPASIGLLLRGDAAAGLDNPPPKAASPRSLQAWIVASELLVLVLSAWAGAVAYLRWGPGRMRGMATKGQAEELLGPSRLRKTRAVVRPDLYGKGGKQ